MSKHGRRYTRDQAQAMVNRAYAQALNDAASGTAEPWQDGVPQVKELRRDLRAAGTWPEREPAEEGPAEPGEPAE